MKKTNEMSKLAGVSKRTLQYYDDEGLLMTERTKDNHRLYDRQAMKRIWEILVYKEMDFELREIRQIFQSTEEEKNQWLDRRRDVISRQIEEQKQKIAIIAFVQKYGMPPVPQENKRSENYESNDGKMNAGTVTGEAGFQEFQKTASIEETILYNSDDILITATELGYTDYSADISVVIENNSEKDLTFISNSIGYSCNSVNGYMIADGYINSSVAAGKKANETLSLSYDMLRLYGIFEIADIEIGFDISDDEYNHIYTGPCQIRTSIADQYDYQRQSYRETVVDELKDAYGIQSVGTVTLTMEFENQEGEKIGDPAMITVENPNAVSEFSQEGEEVYNSDSIRIVMKDVIEEDSEYSGDMYVLLMVENKTSENITITDVYDSLAVNGYMMDSIISPVNIKGGSSAIMKIQLWQSDLEENSIEDISDISQVEIGIQVMQGDHIIEETKLDMSI